MSIEYSFTAPVEKVFDRLTDVDYLVDRSLALGELSAECVVEEDQRQTVITMTREVERALPSFLARLFNTKQTIELVEQWTRAGKGFEGSYRLQVKGQPVTVDAKLQLKPVRGGCVYVIEHTCKAAIPLLGRRIESFMLDQIVDGTHAELDHLAASLGQ